VHHEDTKSTKDKSDRVSFEVIGAAIEVHRILGPGLLESAYEKALCHELSLRKVHFERQRPLPVVYKGIHLDCSYRLDLVVENRLIVELKAVQTMEPLFEAQLLTYLIALQKPQNLIPLKKPEM